jgi:hypothetical protein
MTINGSFVHLYAGIDKIAHYAKPLEMFEGTRVDDGGS